MANRTGDDHRARSIDLIKRSVSNYLYLGGDSRFRRFSCKVAIEQYRKAQRIDDAIVEHDGNGW